MLTALGHNSLRAALAILTMLLAPAITTAAELNTFHAEYVMSYAVFTGDVKIDLRQEDTPGSYSYKITTKARGLAKAIMHNKAVEKSQFTIDGNNIKPLSYHLDDGFSGKENKTDIKFDWDTGIAHSRYEGADLSKRLKTGTLDRLSADIIVIMALRAGIEPGGYPIFDGEDVDVYEFTKLGTERIKVQAGKFDTVKYRRQRAGSSRSTLIWYAPAQDYLPVRIDQQKDGKTSVTMTATQLRPGAR
jgi:hypothetical protein